MDFQTEILEAIQKDFLQHKEGNERISEKERE